MIPVGVGTGEGWAEFAAAIESGAGCGWCAVGTAPVYRSPSSPGAKARFEQNPSEELMMRVKPSLDLEKH